MTLGNHLDRAEALAIILEASRFQLGDAMRIAGSLPAVQSMVGFNAHEEIMAQGVLNDALRYLETGSTSGLRYGAYFMADAVFTPKKRERAA